MTAPESIESIQRAALELRPAARADPARAASLATFTEDGIAGLWRAEAARRDVEMESGNVTGARADEVLREVRARYRKQCWRANSIPLRGWSSRTRSPGTNRSGRARTWRSPRVEAGIDPPRKFPESARATVGPVRPLLLQPSSRWHFTLPCSSVGPSGTRIPPLAHQSRQPFYWFERR